MQDKIKMMSQEANTKVIKLIGEVIEDVTFQDLKEQAGDPDNFDTLIIEIASPGGSVVEGLRIMGWFDSLSRLEKNIITIVTANAYSIASLIMLVAHYRVISKHGKIMVHNPMIPELKYVNADELEKYASQLRELESTLHSLYEMFTGLDAEKVKELMDKETYISPEEAKEYGFVNDVIDMEKRSYEMTINNQKEVNMSKTVNKLNRIIAKFTDAEVINQLYYTTEGKEINIFQKDPSSYALEDRTDVESGEIKIADGAVLTIENYVIKNIERGVSSETDGVEDSFNEGAAPKKEEENVSPQNTEITEITKWESEVINDSFEIGEKVEYKPYGDSDEPTAVGAGEFELADGTKILTDSNGIIRWKSNMEEPMETPEEEPIEEPAEEPAIEPIEVPEEPVEEKADEEKMKEEEMKEDEMKSKEYENLVSETSELKATVAKLIERVESLEATNKSINSDIVNLKSFESTATEAIDALANSKVSNFKPKPKLSKASTSGSNSIFKAAKERVGLK